MIDKLRKEVTRHNPIYAAKINEIIDVVNGLILASLSPEEFQAYVASQTSEERP